MLRSGAPVWADGFSFAHGELFVETSGRNRHRRVTPAELQEHFTSGSDKDHPAHWFEAQLLHYGLQPSKAKSVARMRLFDALNAGRLAVPAHIAALEKQLKKQWTKQDKEAKAGVKGKGKGTETATTNKSAGVKRRADVNITVTINTNISSDSPNKKFKTVEPTTPPAAQPLSNTKAAAKKQSARRGSAVWQGSNAAARLWHAVESLSPAAENDQYNTHGGFDDYDDSPPPYSTYPEDGHDYYRDSSLAPLGLLNGRYDIGCPYVTLEWPSYGSDFDLVLTLAGSTMWGWFDLGWRGREDQGSILDGDHNRGWIKFLGDGRIEGQFDYKRINFQGRRLPGQGTRSEADAHSLQREWNEYSEDESEWQY